MIEYRVIGRRIFGWVVVKDGVEMVELPITSAVVSRDVARLRTAAAGEWLDVCSSLYEGLLHPLQGSLRGITSVVIIPDDELERVPYPALYDRSRRRYVVQDLVTIVAPSIRLFEGSVRRFRDRAPTRERMLIVIGPTGSAQNSARLDGAAREATSLTAIFPDARFISDTTATRSDVLRALEQATILHFAGHARQDNTDGSQLVVAGGSLTPDDVMAARLPSLRVAVLAACGTNAGPIRKAEGTNSIASSFFAAGVPTVVATLWDVEDDASVRIVELFYKYLRRGLDAGGALRAAQLTLLSRSDGSPSDWAAFRVIGAGLADAAFEERRSGADV